MEGGPQQSPIPQGTWIFSGHHWSLGHQRSDLGLTRISCVYFLRCLSQKAPLNRERQAGPTSDSCPNPACSLEPGTQWRLGTWQLTSSVKSNAREQGASDGPESLPQDC